MCLQIPLVRNVISETIKKFRVRADMNQWKSFSGKIIGKAPEPDFAVLISSVFQQVSQKIAKKSL